MGKITVTLDTKDLDQIVESLDYHFDMTDSQTEDKNNKRISKDLRSQIASKTEYPNGLVNKQLVMEAWVFLREKNSSIPSETLDFMRDKANEAIDRIEGQPRKGIDLVADSYLMAKGIDAHFDAFIEGYDEKPCPYCDAVQYSGGDITHDKDCATEIAKLVLKDF